jgi:hypothetical protein
MPKYETIEMQIERRTYIKGKFKGKFIGYFDPRKSDGQHENFYDLEVISGEIKTTKDKDHIRHWETGEPEEFQPIEKFLTNLPENLPIEVRDENGSVKTYTVNLNEKKLSNFKLSNQIYENKKVFGDIFGDISGYIKHYNVEYIQVEIPEEVTKVPIPTPVSTKVKTYKQTGNTETSGNYKRWEYYFSDGSTYWGPWEKQSSYDSGYSLWEILGILIQILLVAAIVIPLLIYGWQIILPIAIVIGLVYLLSTFGNIIFNLFKWLFRLAGIAFFLFLILGIISLFTTTIKSPVVKRDVVTDTEKEVREIKPDPITGDSIISHHRIWQGYSNQEYAANIEVRVTDYRNATQLRNNLPIPLQSTSQYNRIVSTIYDYDRNKLDLMYSMLDSLQVENNLTQIEFAEVIVTLIQDIPYSLILPDACDARIYNDDFIREYLSTGGNCEGHIKYGLLSPIEFMASLAGDCDTRTLLLFTVLNHYGYEVAMLSSELYKHSIIGINLPYNGLSKTINGKRYVVWETTSQGIPPGIIPREISDMRFWNVSLISNKNLSL